MQSEARALERGGGQPRSIESAQYAEGHPSGAICTTACAGAAWVTRRRPTHAVVPEPSPACLHTLTVAGWSGSSPSGIYLQPHQSPHLVPIQSPSSQRAPQHPAATSSPGVATTATQSSPTFSCRRPGDKSVSPTSLSEVFKFPNTVKFACPETNAEGQGHASRASNQSDATECKS
jgi:hypothetical protein